MFDEKAQTEIRWKMDIPADPSGFFLGIEQTVFSQSTGCAIPVEFFKNPLELSIQWIGKKPPVRCPKKIHWGPLESPFSSGFLFRLFRQTFFSSRKIPKKEGIKRKSESSTGLMDFKRRPTEISTGGKIPMVLNVSCRQGKLPISARVMSGSQTRTSRRRVV